MKAQENKLSKSPYDSNRSFRSIVSGSASLQFKDNRSEKSIPLKMQEMANQAIQRKENKTGMPDQLKSGIENLSGVDMSDVKVHYNSPQPAQLQAHAYAQGNQIHLASGQEKHLPHEAWHVVQQKQGRVQPTKQLKGKTNINDDAGLEKEADVMGARALLFNQSTVQKKRSSLLASKAIQRVIQRAATSIHYDTTSFDMETPDHKKEIVGKKMIANLNPADEVRGSAPGKGVQAELMGTLKASGYRRMIRGHLLNGQLGGLGIAANLFPITSQANSKHKNHVENPIKAQIKKGKEIKYQVTVNSANKMSNPNAQFICDAKATDGTWSRAETINSLPGKVAKRGNNVEGSTSNGSASMSFSSSSLPSGWGQKSSGYSSKNANHTKSVGKSSFTFNGKAHDDIDGKLYAQGAHFNLGLIDRQQYANELIEEYDEQAGTNWPVYFNSKPYTKKEIEDFVDTVDSDVLEKIITRIKGLL